ncbi:MAG: hypothetical protein CME70_11265 [Halobacteriovorax sp.]|nr:hypothetical protein [Halobacteriovorax sp.]
MKPVFVTLFLLITINASLAEDCKIDDSNAYFEDLVGEPYGDPGSGQYKVIFEKILTFSPDPPLEASLVFPFKGNCSGLIFHKVEVFGAIGPDSFPKGYNKDNLEKKYLTWQKKPLSFEKKHLILRSNLAILKTFKILNMMKKAPEGKHIWKFKFVVRYQETDGVTKVYKKIIDSHLIH